MELETNQESSSSTTSTQASSEQPQAQVSSPQAQETVSPQAAQASGTEGQPAVPQAYSANFKFNVLNQEHEMDEFIRGAIKDAETEKKARELYQKAYGLDVLKPRFQETREKYKNVETQYNTLQTRVNSIMSKKEKDMDGFFKDLGINDEKLFQYVYDKLNYQNLPQEQKQAIEARKAAESRALEQETKYQSLAQQYQQQAVQARTVELSSVLARPEFKSISDVFDARVGQPGAFEAEVIRRGQLAYYTQGKDITVDEAVQEALQVVGKLVEPAATPAAQGAPQATPAPAAQQKPPVIPAVSGRTSSPARRSPKSLDELRKMASQIR